MILIDGSVTALNVCSPTGPQGEGALSVRLGHEGVVVDPEADSERCSPGNLDRVRDES